MQTITTWKSGKAFTSQYRGIDLEIDGDGFSPKALLLTGLAGCTGIDLESLLEKMRVPFGSIEIIASADVTDDHPKVFKSITLVYKIKTGEENRDKVTKAIDLSLDKYCGVAAMLRKAAPIDYSIELVEE